MWLRRTGENLYILNDQKINIVAASSGEMTGLSEIVMGDRPVCDRIVSGRGQTYCDILRVPVWPTGKRMRMRAAETENLPVRMYMM